MKDPGLITRHYIKEKVEKGESFNPKELDRVEEYFKIKKEMREKGRVSLNEFKKTKKLIRKALN